MLQEVAKKKRRDSNNYFFADVSQSTRFVRVGRNESPTWARSSRMVVLRPQQPATSRPKRLGGLDGIVPGPGRLLCSPGAGLIQDELALVDSAVALPRRRLVRSPGEGVMQDGVIFLK